MDFYFDFISPYAYLAWTQIRRIAAAHGRAVDPVPVLFAALLDHHGTRGPAEVPAKRRYLLTDTHRKARTLGVPYGPPRHHPFNPLLALRAASVPVDTETRQDLVDRMFAAAWSGEGADLEDETTVLRLAGDVGLDGRAVLDAARSPEVKSRLKEQTARAIANGVFGVPTIIAGDEPFWGVDSLPDLDRFLRDGRPAVDRATLDRWAAVTPSAERPGSNR